MIDQYLDYIQEGLFSKFVDPDNPKLPNPFNFRQIKLDPKVINSDFKKGQPRFDIANSFEKKVREPNLKRALTIPFKPTGEGGFNTGQKMTSKIFTILDKSTRVGIIWIQDYVFRLKEKPIYGGDIGYVTWVPGKRYATRAVMALLNLPIFVHTPVSGRVAEYSIQIKKDNKASLKTAQKLKAKTWTTGDGETVNFDLRPPYWWNGKKYLDFRKKT